jgi:hypothetical protein
MNDVNTYSNLLSQRRISHVFEENVTAWIIAIQNATIKCLNSTDEFEENRSFIQVKRMNAHDLQSETNDQLLFTEDAYEQSLDVVRLPIPIPQELAQTAPDFLFIRPDDIALFRSITNGQRSVLIGNPDISKSWFQWKFIMFCFRQDLFELLFRNEHIIDPEVSTIDPENYDNVVPRKRSKISLFPLPKFILRTLNGHLSLWFAIDRFEKVLLISHRPEDLVQITDANTTVLWEPTEMTNPIFSTGTVCKIIATVSPDPARYHGIAKTAQKFYMPCPSELQIRLMGKIYRKFAGEENLPNDNIVRSRVKEYGPFIRIALSPYLGIVREFGEKRDLEIKMLFSQPRDWSQILMSNHNLEQELKITDEMVNFSHRLARFVVKRNASDKFGGYTSHWYRFSCEYVLGHIQKEIAKAGIDFVMNHLVTVNRGMMNFEDVNPYFLERVFELHALSGIHWKFAPLNGSVEWKDFQVKLESVNRSLTAFDDMKPGILYCPSDRMYPLLGMYYKDPQNTLVCIQATTAKGHAKPFLTHKEFFGAVLSSEKVAVHLYHLTLPCQKDSFVATSISYSKFNVGLKSNNMAKWNPNLSFYCLLLPDSFERKY